MPRAEQDVVGSGTRAPSGRPAFQPHSGAAPIGTLDPVGLAAELLGASFSTQSALSPVDPLSDLAASQFALTVHGGQAPGLDTLGNQSILRELSALACSPIMARRGLHRDAADSSRYVLPEAARDGQAMIARAGGGRPLPDDTRARMEAILGRDLRSVRIHDDATADVLARQVDARAFTVGEHIVFAQGLFEPGSREGDTLLAHELTHVLQFRRNDPNTQSADPVSVKAAEDEADREGARIASILSGAAFAEGAFAGDAFGADALGVDESPDAAAPATGVAAPASGVVARDETATSSELAQLIHRYRRLLRRIQNEEHTISEFESAADEENRSSEAHNVDELRADLARDRAGRDEVLARLRTLKGEAYTQAIIDRYSGDQGRGPWTFERERTIAEGERGGGRSTDAPDAEEGGDSDAGSGEDTNAATEGGTGSGTPDSGDGRAEESPAEGTPDTGTSSGGGGTRDEGTEDVRQDLAQGPVPTGHTPPAAPDTAPGAHVDDDETSGADDSADDRTWHETEGGVPETQDDPAGEGTRYVLYEGAYADVVLDVGYLEFDGEMTGDLGQAATLPELAQELRNARGIADVVHVISQFDPENFEMTGEISAALNLIRGTLTVEGAPWPVNLGGQDFLVDWTLILTARAYAEIVASGQVTPDLGNLSLEATGRAGAAALLEGSATISSSLDWMGDSYSALAEASVTAAGSLGAAAEAHATLRIGPAVIEITGGASVTWGAGGSVRGRLLVAILPTLELIATYLGVDLQNLPEPLNNVYRFFTENPDVLHGILDAWTWLREMKPLQLLADVLTSEEFWQLFDRLVETGVESIQIVNWIRENYVQLDDTPPHGTVCGHAFDSATIWYLLSFGMDFLSWMERIGRDVALELLPLMTAASRLVLTAVINAGPWIADIIRTGWSAVVRLGEILGERFGPVLEALGRHFLTIWNRFGEPVVVWVGERLAAGWAWLTDLIDEYGPEFITWCQSLPERMQTWFETVTPQVVEALWQGGERLVAAVGELGQEVLAYIERWAPGVVAIFRNITEDLYNAIIRYGTRFFEWVVQVGESALQLVGPHLERLWAAIQTGTQDFVAWLATVARDNIQPFLALLDAHGGAVLTQIRAWIEENGPGFLTWISTNFSEFVSSVSAIWGQIQPYLATIGAHLVDFWTWFLEVSAPVRAWVGTAAAWLFARLQEQGAELIARLRRLGDLVIRIYEWGEPYLVQAIELCTEAANFWADLIEEYGPQALDWAREAGAEVYSQFTAATQVALGHLIAAGTWTRDLMVAIGAPLIPVVQEWGARLATLGADVKDDLLEMWRDYGEPVFRFALRVGRVLWDEYGQTLSRVMPILDRMVRDGAATAVDFMEHVITQQRQVMEVMLELTADGLTRLYTWATTDGVDLANRIAAQATEILNRMRAAGEEILFHFIEFGEWVGELGDDAAEPYREVLDRYGERYGRIFRQYGQPIVEFFVELGEAAAALIDELGDALAQAIVSLGRAIYDFARPILAEALRVVVAAGTWIWGHLVEFGQGLLDVARRVGAAAMRAWESYGRPAVRFMVELGVQAYQLYQEFNQALFRLVVRIGETVYTWARDTAIATLRRIMEAGEWLIDVVVELGTPVVTFLAECAAEAWTFLADKWQRYGAPVVRFCVDLGQRVGAFIAEVAQVIGEAIWEQIQSDARAIYRIYVQYGAPVIQAIGDAVIESGRWLWNRFVDQTRQQIDTAIAWGNAALSALRTVGQAAWDAAQAIGRAFRDLWNAYGQPIVDQLVAAGRYVADVYNRYGAPIVRRCMDALAEAGQAVWEFAADLGQQAFDLARSVGSAIWGWIREAGATAWRNLRDAGARMWDLCRRLGRSALDLVRRYGPQAIDLGRRATEAIVLAIANHGAQQLERILEGGAVLLETIGRLGVGLINLIHDAPHLARQIRDHGAHVADLAVQHGAAFARAMANAPSRVWSLVQQNGAWLARMIVERGSAFVTQLGRYGARLVGYAQSVGGWFVDMVAEYGGQVLDLADEYGTRFISMLQRVGSAALSWFGDDDDEADRDAAGADPTGGLDEGAAQAAMARSTGTSLPEGTASRMGAAMGADLSDMRVHTGPAAQEAATALNARAFAVGNDVYFGAGEYAPGSSQGDTLIAHEATHVVQQQGGAARMAFKLEVSSPGDATEREADRVASNVVAGKAAGPISGAPGAMSRQVAMRDPVPGGPAPRLPRVGDVVEATVGGRRQRVRVSAVRTGDSTVIEVEDHAGNTYELTPSDVRPVERSGAVVGIGGGDAAAGTSTGTDGEDTADEVAECVEDEAGAGEAEGAEEVTAPEGTDPSGDGGMALAGPVSSGAPMPPLLSPVAGSGPATGVGPLLGPAAPAISDPVGEIITDATGMTPDQHADEIASSLGDLGTSMAADADALASAADEGATAVTSTASSEVAAVTSTGGTGTDAIATGFDDARTSIDGATTDAIATGDAAADVSTEEAEAARLEGVAMAEAYLAAQAAELDTMRAGWQGSMAATLETYAQQVEAFGEQRRAAMATREEEARTTERAEGAQGTTVSETSRGSGAVWNHARAEVTAKAQKDAFHRYGPSIVAYCEQAAASLRAMVGETALQAGEIVAPALDDLDPTRVQRIQRAEEDAEAARLARERERELQRRELEAARAAHHGTLDDGEAAATDVIEGATADLSDRIDEAADAVADHEEGAAAELVDGRADTVAALDAAAAGEGVPDAAPIRDAASDAADAMRATTDDEVATLREDADRARDRIATRGAEGRTAIADGATEIADGAREVAGDASGAIRTGADEAAATVREASAEHVAAEGERGRELADSLTAAGATTGVAATEQEAAVLADLDAFVQQVQTAVNQLETHADGAAQGAGQSAVSSMEEDIRRRSRTIYSAVDGWGTDETGMLRNLMGLSAAQAGALITQYADDAGNPILADIKDDLDYEGGEAHIWAACRAYLSGDQVTGAREAIHWATEEANGIERMWQSDRATMVSAMETLDENDRWELVHSEGFPELRTTVLETLRDQDIWRPSLSFQPESYETRIFEALSDPELDHRTATMHARALRIAEAGDSLSLNPVTWGTDESGIFAQISACQTAEDGAALEAAFLDATGMDLRTWLASELRDGAFEDSRDYDRAIAYLDGNPERARAIAVQQGLLENEQDQVLDQLRDTNLESDSDWLAHHTAGANRETFNTEFVDYTGYDADLTIGVYFDAETGSREDYARRLAMSYLEGERPDVADMIGYGTAGNGTREERVTAAVTELRSRLAGKSADERRTMIADVERQLQEDGLLGPGETLDQFLGTGDYIDGSFYELEGENRHEVDMILSEAMRDETNVQHLWELARRDYEWYRGELADDETSQTEIADAITDSGARLDELYVALRTLHDDHTWWNTETGAPNEQTSSEWASYQSTYRSIRNMTQVFRDRRDSLADTAAAVVLAIAAIAATIVTGGTTAPLWAGAAIGLAGAGIAIGVRMAIQGNGYSTEQALRDAASALVDAIVALVTAGVGTQRIKAMLDAMKEAGMARQFLAAALVQIPGALRDRLMDERMWDSPNWGEELAAGLGVSALQIIARSGAELSANAIIRENQIKGIGEVLLRSTFTEGMRVYTDPATLRGSPMQALWSMIQGIGTAALGHLGATAVRGEVVRRINEAGIDDDTRRRLGRCDPDTRQKIVEALDPSVRAEIGATHLRSWGLDANGRPLPAGEEEEAPPAPAPEEDPEDTTPEPEVAGDSDAEDRDGGTPQSTEAEDEADLAATTPVHTPETSAPDAEVPAAVPHAETVRALNDLDHDALRNRLMDVPGIGETLADRILSERARGGPFRDMDDLRARVNGVGEGRAAAIAAHLDTSAPGTRTVAPHTEEEHPPEDPASTPHPEEHPADDGPASPGLSEEEERRRAAAEAEATDDADAAEIERIVRTTGTGEDTADESTPGLPSHGMEDPEMLDRARRAQAAADAGRVDEAGEILDELHAHFMSDEMEDTPWGRAVRGAESEAEQREISAEMATYMAVMRSTPDAMRPDQMDAVVRTHARLYSEISEGTMMRKFLAGDAAGGMVSEEYGDTTVGGSVGVAGNTDGLGAHEVVAGLGLDYRDSPFVHDTAAGPTAVDEVFYMEFAADQAQIDQMRVPLGARLEAHARDMAAAGDPLAAALVEGHGGPGGPGGIQTRDAAYAGDPFTGSGGTAHGPDLRSATGGPLYEAPNQELGMATRVPVRSGAVLYALGADGRSVPVARLVQDRGPDGRFTSGTRWEMDPDLPATSPELATRVQGWITTRAMRTRAP